MARVDFRSKVSIYFNEPAVEDPTYASRGESTTDWLKRSTLPTAVEAREFLNCNLSAIPSQERKPIFNLLKNRWSSGLLELVMARIIQELGGSFTREEKNSEGRRPDFRVQLGSDRIVFEATAPEFEQGTKSRQKQNIQLLEIVERHIPDDWDVMLFELPKIGPNESKKRFQSALKKIFSIDPPADDADIRKIDYKLPQGSIEMTLLPGKYGGEILGGPGYSGSSDTKKSIRNALKRKRSQVRSEKYPVVLAILGSGIFTKFEDFDLELFGHTVSRVDRKLGSIAYTKFEPDGALAKEKGSQTYAGVLVFLGLTPFRCKGPVLYWSPWAGPIPDYFSAFKRRILGNGEGIKTLEAQGPNPLQAIIRKSPE